MRIPQVVATILLLYEGINEALNTCNDFYSLEEKIAIVVREASCMVLKEVLERLDDRLLACRDENLEVWRMKERKITSSFGEFEIRRRLYRDKRTGEARFLLDEALGLEKRARVSPRMRELMVELALDVPFRRAAQIIGKWLPGVSAMTVWNAVKEVGEKAREEAKELREKVFERGERLGGTRKIKRLNIEADGVNVKIQKSKLKKAEIKLGVAYEGKVSKGKSFELCGRRVVAGLVEGEAFWEEAVARFGEHWDLDSVNEVLVGGDGASWPKAGVEFFEGAKYCLDEFHLRRFMREALGHDPESYDKVSEALRGKDREGVEKHLLEAEKKATGQKRKKVKKFRQYVFDNWEGIRKSEEVNRLGTIEGQVYHHIARRMKRLGARWSIAGGDRMARLLAARADGELQRYRVPGQTISACFQDDLAKRISRLKSPTLLEKTAEDVSAWLKAKVPALEGPKQSTPFVKYILRQLVNYAAVC